MHDRRDMTRVLLRFGADPHQLTGDGKSALQLAEAQGYGAMVGLLNGG